MKLDDRDIIAQPSYEPLSNAELVAHIKTYAGLIYDTPLAERGAWQDDIIGPARVLLARINAAETERNTAARRAFNAEAENQRLAAENRQLLARAEAAENERDELRDECSRAEMAAIYFEARVAELEAALAAQQWIEVDDDPDMYNWYLTYNAEAEDLDNIGMNVSFYDGTWEHECTHYRPLPPAPQETE